MVSLVLHTIGMKMYSGTAEKLIFTRWVNGKVLIYLHFRQGNNKFNVIEAPDGCT